MRYDLRNPIDRERFKKRVNALFVKQSVVECTEYKPKRTSPQNRYFHIILGEFAMQYGETLDYVKRELFKLHCNADIFVTKKQDKILGAVEIIKSSADIDTGEMTTAIERFRNFSSKEAEIYLPAPNETEYLEYIEREMKRNEIYI